MAAEGGARARQLTAREKQCFSTVLPDRFRPEAVKREPSWQGEDLVALGEAGRSPPA